MLDKLKELLGLGSKPAGDTAPMATPAAPVESTAVEGQTAEVTLEEAPVVAEVAMDMGAEVEEVTTEEEASEKMEGCQCGGDCECHKEYEEELSVELTEEETEMPGNNTEVVTELETEPQAFAQPETATESQTEAQTETEVNQIPQA